MKNIRATESYSNPKNENLFTTYFPFIDSFTNGGIYSQVISGVTEYLFIVSAIYPQLLLYTNYKLSLAISLVIGCIVVAIVEIGQRKSLKAASKAIFNKQYKTKIEIILLVFALVCWLGLIVTSVALSILPVKEVMSPTAKSANTTELDSLYRFDIATIETNQLQKVNNTRTTFESQIKGIESKYDAKVNSSNVAIKKHRKSLAIGNKWAASHITKEKGNIASYEVSKTNEISIINEKLNNEIKAIQAHYENKSNNSDSLYHADKSDIITAHATNENQKITRSNIYTYSITFLICVCILLTSFSIFVKESFIKGSEIDVTNEIENKLEPIIPRLWNKLKLKIYFFFDKYANLSEELQQKYNSRTSKKNPNTTPNTYKQPAQIGFNIGGNADTQNDANPLFAQGLHKNTIPSDTVPDTEETQHNLYTIEHNGKRYKMNDVDRFIKTYKGRVINAKGQKTKDNNSAWVTYWNGKKSELDTLMNNE